ncbi:unnamed protein product, partial [Mesorhabditis belari]|uniref:Uncharacterized protein n=1 Tax=Mesorhabditis belari TaxID=2138241 RepID=A0AAF3FCC4_9BILA
MVLQFQQLTLLVLLVGASANWANWSSVALLPTCDGDDGLSNQNASFLLTSIISLPFFPAELCEISTALPIPTERYSFDCFFVTFFVVCIIFVVAVMLEEDQEAVDSYADFIPVTHVARAPLPPVKIQRGRVMLSIKSLRVEALDENLAIPQKERIQDVHFISATFSGSYKIAYPGRSFLYIHYRPIGIPKVPFVLFYNTDNNGRALVSMPEEDGLKWEFKIDTHDESAFSTEQLAQGYYAMHKVYVHFLDAEASKNFVNSQKVVFKVQRAITSPSSTTATTASPSSVTRGSFTPAAKKNSLPKMAFLKSLRSSLKTSLREVATAFRKTPSKTCNDIDAKNFKAKGSFSAPSLNLDSTSEC